MQITVRVADVFARHMPSGKVEEVLEIEGEATALDVVASLGMDPEVKYLMLLNDALLPRAERTSRQLVEGDKLSILVPLKGG